MHHSNKLVVCSASARNNVDKHLACAADLLECGQILVCRHSVTQLSLRERKNPACLTGKNAVTPPPSQLQFMSTALLIVVCEHI